MGAPSPFSRWNAAGLMTGPKTPVRVGHSRSPLSHSLIGSLSISVYLSGTHCACLERTFQSRHRNGLLQPESAEEQHSALLPL